jgi:hypothetical protein
MTKTDRVSYSDEAKALVRAKYPFCLTSDDRVALAEQLGITLPKLYNLASRQQATRPHSDRADGYQEDVEIYDPVTDIGRLYLRDDPDQLVWTEHADSYITKAWGRVPAEAIGFFLDRTEASVAYRARVLGIREVPKYYDIKKVAPWLGLSYRNLFLLSRRGLGLFPCTDRRGELTITLVSTSSLARVLLKDGFWKTLVSDYAADEIFIRDVVESMVAVQDGSATWEANAWVSHAHTCLNPFSEACFGLFYTGFDGKMSGSDLDPRDLAPSANVTSDDWRRGRHIERVAALKAAAA